MANLLAFKKELWYSNRYATDKFIQHVSSLRTWCSLFVEKVINFTIGSIRTCHNWIIGMSDVLSRTGFQLNDEIPPSVRFQWPFHFPAGYQMRIFCTAVGDVISFAVGIFIAFGRTARDPSITSHRSTPCHSRGLRSREQKTCALSLVDAESDGWGLGPSFYLGGIDERNDTIIIMKATSGSNRIFRRKCFATDSKAEFNEKNRQI